MSTASGDDRNNHHRQNDQHQAPNQHGKQGAFCSFFAKAYDGLLVVFGGLGHAVPACHVRKHQAVADKDRADASRKTVDAV